MVGDRGQVHVVHLTTVHKPFDVRIFHKECKSLAAAGYRVSLIQSDCDAGIVDGVEIVPIPRHHRRIVRMTLGVAQAVAAARRIGADVVHFHDVELIWGAFVLKLLGKKVVYDVHEDVAKDLEDKAYLPSWARAPIRLAVHGFEYVAQLICDRIIGATKSIHARFAPERATLVRNSPILGEFSAGEAPPFTERRNIAAYLGGLAAFNGPVAMVDAMARVPDELEPRLILGGSFPDSSLEARVRGSDGWQRVDFRGWVPRSAISDIFTQARCGLVLYQPTPNVIDSEPNKFFEVMSAGLPLVASDFPVWRNLIEQFECGIAVDPNDPAAIAAAIEYMFRNPTEAEAMGRRGRDAILNGYNWSVDGNTLVNLYDRLTGSAQPDAQHA